LARLRIGTVPYLVARPLGWGLAEQPGVELLVAPPSVLARELRAGRLDVALASSILCDRVQGPDGEGLCLWEEGPVIAARGAVRSVLLLLRPGLPGPEAVRRLCPDPHSRTGRALARIVLADAFGAAFEELVSPAGSDPFASGADAVQRIGDPALRERVRRRDWTVLDLGATWRTLTRRAFVYAGWIGRPGFDPALAAAPLLEAAEKGLAARSALVAEGACRLGLEEAFLRRYLFEDLAYDLPAAEVRGALEEFGRRLARHPEPALSPGSPGDPRSPGG